MGHSSLLPQRAPAVVLAALTALAGCVGGSAGALDSGGRDDGGSTGDGGARCVDPGQIAVTLDAGCRVFPLESTGGDINGRWCMVSTCIDPAGFADTARGWAADAWSSSCVNADAGISLTGLTVMSHESIEATDVLSTPIWSGEVVWRDDWTWTVSVHLSSGCVGPSPNCSSLGCVDAGTVDAGGDAEGCDCQVVKTATDNAYFIPLHAYTGPITDGGLADGGIVLHLFGPGYSDIRDQPVKYSVRGGVLTIESIARYGYSVFVQ